MPARKLKPSDWADENGILTGGDANAGKWRTIGWQRAIMDCFVEYAVEEVTLIKSAQLGWTQIIKHIIGYFVDINPCNMLITQPTSDDADDWAKDQLQPFFDECKALIGKFLPPRTKDSKNTITKKYFDGYTLRVSGANSPRAFRRITSKVTLFDELDGHEDTKRTQREGDKTQLGKNRGESYADSKIAYGSTPTDLTTSKILQKSRESSLGYYFLTCPHCGGEHIRKFRQPDKPLVIRDEKVKISILTWPEENTNKAAWECPDCGELIEQKHHRAMVNSGRWIADDWEWSEDSGFTFFDSFQGHIGFSIWAGYSFAPKSTPARIAKRFITAKRKMEKQGDPEELQTVVNTVFGEPWDDGQKNIDDESIAARSEVYPAEVPAGALILTFGMDIQLDRIECEVVGWSEHEESWSIDYIVIPGDWTQKGFRDEVRVTLQNLRYKHESGASLAVVAGVVDAGYLTSNVVSFVKSWNYEYIWAGKGTAGKYPVTEERDNRVLRMRKRSSKTPLERIGVDEAKTILYRRLAIEKPGPGYCHFPKHYDAEYFAQLAAEKIKPRYVKGFLIREWVKLRPRNEALDCRNYAFAALRLSNPNWAEWNAVQNTTNVTAKRRRTLSKGI